MQQLGRYQLIRKVATGGMAEVFLAKALGPLGFEKTLVLKRILPHLAEEPSFVEMFLGEARLAAQLNHPNIVQIFDFGEADGEYFIAMEYIDGPNLRLLLKRAAAQGLALPPTLCARIISSACEGLAFAHDLRDPNTCAPLGLIHRDISPDNILVSRQGTVKVLDFGIAKAAGQSHKTQSGIIKGKLAYMPPEQIRAQELDRRVDVYALGIVLYELLTGHKPFAAPTDASLMHAILSEPLPPATEHRPDLPESVQRILDRALARDREQRYPDCPTFAMDLEELIHSTSDRVTPQQIAQLVSQVDPGTDRPVPTPQPGAAGSKPRPSATPVHTPDMFYRGAGTDPHGKTVPLPVPEPMAKEQGSRARSRRATRWLSAILSAVVLAMGGGFLFWGTCLGPASTSRSVDAQPSAPVAKPPEQSYQPPPEQPPVVLKVENPPAGAGDKPAAVQRPPVRTKRPQPPGRVDFHFYPYATVTINGKDIGQTPFDPVSLPAGTYRVKYANSELGIEKTETIVVKAGEFQTFSRSLEK